MLARFFSVTQEEEEEEQESRILGVRIHWCTLGRDICLQTSFGRIKPSTRKQEARQNNGQKTLDKRGIRVRRRKHSGICVRKGKHSVINIQGIKSGDKI